MNMRRLACGQRGMRFANACDVPWFPPHPGQPSSFFYMARYAFALLYEQKKLISLPPRHFGVSCSVRQTCLCDCSSEKNIILSLSWKKRSTTIFTYNNNYVVAKRQKKFFSFFRLDTTLFAALTSQTLHIFYRKTWCFSCVNFFTAKISVFQL